MITYPITDQQIEAAKIKFPGVQLERLKHPDLPDQVIVRPAKPDEWTIYLNKQQADDNIGASRALVEFCVVFPEKEDLQASLAAHPGLVQTWAMQIRNLTGYSIGATREKL